MTFDCQRSAIEPRGARVRHAFAIGALALSTHAAAQGVSLYGVLDVWAGQARSTSASGAKTTLRQMTNGGMTTSYWGVGGREDLGGGLRAVFALESFLRMDTGSAGRADGDAFFARAAQVGLQDDLWGEVVIGRTGAPTVGALFGTNAFQDSVAFGTAWTNQWGGIVLGDTSMNNSLRYATPVWGGLRLTVQGSLGEERVAAPDRRRGRAHDARVDYSLGPLTLALATRNIDASSDDDGRKQTTVIVGAIYDLKVMRLYGQYLSVDDRYKSATSDVSRSGFSLGARIPLGVGIALLSHSRSSISDSVAATPSRRTSTAIGYDHLLSKRTDIYVNGLTDRFDQPRGTKTVRLGVGLRHRF